MGLNEDTRTRRAIGLFLLAFGVAMGIAAMADQKWVDQKDLDGGYGTYNIGLRKVRQQQQHAEC
jgi:hypothetical protein